MFQTFSDDQILAELGRRFDVSRLMASLSDRDIFLAGGVKKDALVHFKKGRNISLLNFIKILRGAQLLDRLEALLPQTDPESPLALVARAPTHFPRRIRKKKSKDAKGPFRWGDE